jgi:hypothetical protein
MTTRITIVFRDADADARRTVVVEAGPRVAAYYLGDDEQLPLLDRIAIGSPDDSTVAVLDGRELLPDDHWGPAQDWLIPGAELISVTGEPAGGGGEAVAR